MKKIYALPLIETMLNRDLSFPAIAQSGGDVTLVFGSCDNGPDTVIHDGQLEGCFGGDPAGSSMLIRCSETGSAEYELSFESASPGTENCSEGSPFIVQVSLPDGFPSECTVTRSIDEEHCDQCNNTPESLGNNNCNDGIDNDCDGGFDQSDINCAG